MHAEAPPGCINVGWVPLVHRVSSIRIGGAVGANLTNRFITLLTYFLNYRLNRYEIKLMFYYFTLIERIML